MKLIVLTADANTLIYHRGDLIRDFAAAGCQVVSSAAEDYPHVRSFMAALGGRHRAIRMVRSRVNPASDLFTFLDMWRLFRSESPDALFAYTIKSVVYGCVIARLAGVPRVYALLPGLGFTFVRQTTLKGRVLSRLSRWLHRFALRRADVIFLQNNDDLAMLRTEHILPPGVPAHVTAGSGVNCTEYAFDDLAQNPDLAAGRVRFVLVSRLLVSKGVIVFAEAARAIKAQYPNAEFHLVGPFDPNPNRVTEEQVQSWVAEGLITHHGMVRDIPALLRTMHIFCLPTWYREGVPHATLEALAVGRPIITTDSVGARETVTLTPRGLSQQRDGQPLLDGDNGFLLQPQNVQAAQRAMAHYLDNPHTIIEHGRASRKLAEQVFDVRLVNALILREMDLEHSASAVTFTALK